jgi:hypothetical protein
VEKEKLLSALFVVCIGWLCLFFGKTCVYHPLMRQEHAVTGVVVQPSVGSTVTSVLCGQRDAFSNIDNACRFDETTSQYRPFSMAKSSAGSPTAIGSSELLFEHSTCELNDQLVFDGYRNVSPGPPKVPLAGDVVRLKCRSEVHNSFTRFDLGPWTCKLQCEDLYVFEKVCPEATFPDCGAQNAHRFQAD